MLPFDTYEEAEEKANEISVKRLTSISIVKRNGGKKFIVCDGGGNDRKSHDNFIMLITNYETPFEVYSISPKSGEHWDLFPTVERANGYYKELVGCGYRKSITRNF